MAPYPSAKAEVCKTFIPRSNLGGASIFLAGVAELADALDLGSSEQSWGFKSLRPHQFYFLSGILF